LSSTGVTGKKRQRIDLGRLKGLGEKGGKEEITKVIKEYKKRVTGKDTKKNYFIFGRINGRIDVRHCFPLQYNLVCL